MASLGEMLVEARKQAGYSSLDVSHATRIMLPAIQALEDDQHGNLPAPGYVRGYLLSYAKFLGVDPQPLLDQYQLQTGNQRHDAMGHTPLDAGADRHRHEEHDLNWRVMLIAALIILIIGAAVYFAAGLLKKDEPVPPVPTETTATATTQQPEPTVPETLVPFAFEVKAKDNKASDVTIIVDGDIAFEGTLTGGQKKKYSDVTEAKLTIKKPKNVTVTQNGTIIPVPNNGKRTLTAHD